MVRFHTPELTATTVSRSLGLQDRTRVFPHPGSDVTQALPLHWGLTLLICKMGSILSNF